MLLLEKIPLLQMLNCVPKMILILTLILVLMAIWMKNSHFCTCSRKFLGTHPQSTLLPAEPSLTEEKDSLEYLSILSENEILLQNQRGEYFVSNYSLAGLQGEPREVAGDLNRTIEKGWWTQLVDEIFWEEDKGVLLHRDIVSNTWEFIDLFALPQEFISIVRFSERGILLLDSDSNLWLMDLQTQELRFVDTGYSGLAYTDTPDSIWLWKQDSIYRLDRTSIDENIFQSELNPFVTDLELLQDGEVDLRSFMVKGDFLGVVFKVQNNLFYLPDASPGSWQHLSNNASFLRVMKEQCFGLLIINS
jgi:hypothetical protein